MFKIFKDFPISKILASNLFNIFAKFGLVGMAGLVVDTTIYNLLATDILSEQNITNGPLWAKTISVSAAIICNWIGNRYWVFSKKIKNKNDNIYREFIEFTLSSLIGMSVMLVCLYFSHTVLGFRDLLSDNIANLFGLVLSTVVRFVLYRYWVFSENKTNKEAITA